MKNRPIQMPQINHIIAIASGKGGVGKSTLSFYLGYILAQKGLRIGLLDADLYGPSVPVFLGVTSRPRVHEQKYIPHFLHGMHVMSLGFLLKENEPVMWRGPILQTALRQLFVDVFWPPLDILFIDMPPGTGDAHLSIGQSVMLSGVIMISTAQQLALQDTRRCIEMFQKIQTPIWGLIENMGTFHCPHCHQASPLFFREDIKAFCVDAKVPHWGTVPYDANILVKNPMDPQNISQIQGFLEALLPIQKKILQSTHV